MSYRYVKIYSPSSKKRAINDLRNATAQAAVARRSLQTGVPAANPYGPRSTPQETTVFLPQARSQDHRVSAAPGLVVPPRRPGKIAEREPVANNVPQQRPNVSFRVPIDSPAPSPPPAVAPIVKNNSPLQRIFAGVDHPGSKIPPSAAVDRVLHSRMRADPRAVSKVAELNKLVREVMGDGSDSYMRRNLQYESSPAPGLASTPVRFKPYNSAASGLDPHLVWIPQNK